MAKMVGGGEEEAKAVEGKRKRMTLTRVHAVCKEMSWLGVDKSKKGYSTEFERDARMLLHEGREYETVGIKRLDKTGLLKGRARRRRKRKREWVEREKVGRKRVKRRNSLYR